MTHEGVPKHQMAAVRAGHGKDATVPVQQIDVSMPGPDEILVKINWSGLCGSDEALITDGWAGNGAEMVPEAKGISGHEGAGVVVAVGDNMHHRWSVGDRAGIKWFWGLCGECEYCANGGGEELHCPNPKVSGMNVPGTFQQYAVADGTYTSKIPDGVSDEEAAPLMCGGVTAYKGCKKSGVRAGQWVALVGAGGGLGHLAVQYCKAMGMRVIAIDHGDVKRDLCKKLGAEEFIDFQTTKDVAAEVKRITTYGAHGVVVTAYTEAGYGMAPSLLRPLGTMVVIGLPHDTTTIAGAKPSTLVLGELNIVGSVVGTMKDVEEALDLTARGLVHPILTKGTLADVDKYVHRMLDGHQAGRVVLKVS